jgi:hypothetical protein
MCWTGQGIVVAVKKICAKFCIVAKSENELQTSQRVFFW